MVRKSLLDVTGRHIAALETVLDQARCRPGEELHGRVLVTAGQEPVAADGVRMALVACVAVIDGGGEYGTGQEFHRTQVAGATRLDPGQRVELPFRYPVPWQSPLTRLYDQPLVGLSVGLHTELAVDWAPDPGELDPVQVAPTPAQEQILAALARLGFRPVGAQIQRGHLYGVGQQVPFHQVLEFAAPPGWAGRLDRFELVFLADETQSQVLLEVDKPGGFLGLGRTAYERLTVANDDAGEIDCADRIEAWLRRAVPA